MVYLYYCQRKSFTHYPHSHYHHHRHNRWPSSPSWSSSCWSVAELICWQQRGECRSIPGMWRHLFSARITKYSPGRQSSSSLSPVIIFVMSLLMSKRLPYDVFCFVCPKYESAESDNKLQMSIIIIITIKITVKNATTINIESPLTSSLTKLNWIRWNGEEWEECFDIEMTSHHSYKMYKTTEAISWTLSFECRVSVSQPKTKHILHFNNLK